MRSMPARSPDRTRPSGLMRDEMARGTDLVADAAFIAIAWFDDYLRANPIEAEIRDETALPFPKDVLLRAIEIELGLEGDERMADHLVGLGMRLALFAPGIGPRPVRRPAALRLSSLPGLKPSERIAVLEAHHRLAGRYHRMMEAAMVEMEVLEARLRTLRCDRRAK